MKGDFFFLNFISFLKKKKKKIILLVEIERAITSSFITASNYISSWRSKNKTFE